MGGVRGRSSAADQVSRGDVIAFRLAAHRLDERLAEDGLVDAAGRCGVQDSPPGSALLALHARVRAVTAARLASAVADEKSLLQSWCMRGAPFCVPTVDAPVFTTGVLPPTEAAMRHFLPGVAPALDALGMSLAEAVERAGAEIRDVLSGRRLAIVELGAELAARVAGSLPARQRSVWQSPGPYAPNQPLGEGVVHFCIRILTLQRVVCFAPRAGSTAPFVLAEEWLGRPIPEVDPVVARAELVRRYLRCYGPSTRGHFAAWLGVNAADADPWWRLVADELTPVDVGRSAWLRTEDLAALRSAAQPDGVRLLPPRDPYTQMRDRETIVDPTYHALVWKAVGDPGTVLADGEISGIWRPRASGRRLTITVTTFRPLTVRDRSRLQDEAEQVATLRGASSVTVVLVTC